MFDILIDKKEMNVLTFHKYLIITMPKTTNRAAKKGRHNPVLEVDDAEYVKNEEKYLRMEPDKGVKVHSHISQLLQVELIRDNRKQKIKN